MYRKFIYFILGVSLICNSLIASPLPKLFSDGAVLIEPTTNTILFAKNANETFYPASTTKILTSLLLVEDLNEDILVTKTQDALNNVPSDSSQIGLSVGDTYTAFDGVHAIIMASDNFVAYDMAVKDAGNISSFAKKMNEKARMLGATSSNFVNPHGYHDENHYTTPHDLGEIARGAFANETLAQIAGTHTYNFTKQNSGAQIPLTHTSALFDNNSSYYNPHVTSCKTGFHTPAKRTLVTKARYDNIDLIAVVMRADAPNQYADMNALLDYGSQNFKLTKTDSGEVQIKNVSYSDWAEPYVKIALENNWIVPSLRNYMAPISKREFITLLKSAIPAQYQELLDSDIIYNQPSIYKENLNINRKDAALVCYNLLKKLGFEQGVLPTPLQITDLVQVSASYDAPIELMVRSEVMTTDDQGAFYPNDTLSFQQAIYTAYNLSNLLTRFDNYTYTK